MNRPYHMIYAQDAFGIECITVLDEWGMPCLTRAKGIQEMARSLGRRVLYMVRVTPKAV